MLMFCHYVIAWRAIRNGRICGNNWSQVIYTWSYALEKSVQLTLYLYFIIGWLAYLDSEAFGTDKGNEDRAYCVFWDRDDEEPEDVEDDQAEEAGSAAGMAWAEGGGGGGARASNK